jgi:hypothetical protein
MVIHYLNSTQLNPFRARPFKSRSQTCASISSPNTGQPTQPHDQKQYQSQDYPTMIDGAAFPARSNTSAPCKVHSIPIHPPH